MAGGKSSHNLFPIDLQRGCMWPKREARNERYVQTAFLESNHDIPIGKLSHFQIDARMIFSPSRQESRNRLSDRRHPNAKSNFTESQRPRSGGRPP